MIRMSAAAVLLFASAAVHAQESGAPAPQPTTAPNGQIVVDGTAPKEDKVICRREREIGSIRTHRVCRSESQIAEDAARGERTLDHARTQRNNQTVSQNQSGG